MVGIGPGGPEFMTGQARLALEAADVLCGYTLYVDLVRPMFPDKEYITNVIKESKNQILIEFPKLPVLN